MSENNKDMLLDKLYALRAGLSTVSVEMDKVHSLENELSSKKEENANIIRVSKTGKYKVELENIEKKLRRENNELIAKRKNLVKEFEKNDNLLKSEKKSLKFSLNVLLFLFNFAIVSIFLYFVFDWESPLFVLEVLTYIAPIPIVIAIVSSIFSYKKIKKTTPIVDKLRLDIEELDSKIMNENEFVNSLNHNPSYIAALTNDKNAKNDLDNAVNYDYSKYLLAITNQQNKCAAFYNNFHKSYLSSFNDIIDERDWKNLDLIIFMLETKRANTLQEALQQVDLYRSTEMIAKIIIQATNTICSTITRESNKIYSAIQNSVDSINNRLDKIADNQSMLSGSIDTVNANIRESISSMELQNALIKKANTTSEKMADEIEQIKSFVGRPYGHV